MRSSFTSVVLAVLLLAATVAAQQVNCAMYVPDDAATVAGYVESFFRPSPPPSFSRRFLVLFRFCLSFYLYHLSIFPFPLIFSVCPMFSPRSPSLLTLPGSIS
jgi:hypothetical protein